MKAAARSRSRTPWILLLAWGCLSSRGLAFDLITPAEGTRPDDRYKEGDRPGPLLGPRVEVHGILTTTSPFELTVEITPRGGARINVDSLQVTYRKKPAVNLLPRIRNLVSESDRKLVIRIRDAHAPVGKHQILVQVEDTLQHLGRRAIDLEVIPVP